jgi:hypothetical protein
MRIGTWNLAGSWSADHASLLLELGCDVLLLTECPAEATLPGYVRHATVTRISGTDTHWSTVLSTRPMEPLPDPHPASAAVRIEGVVFCASVLPWPLAGDSWPWGPPDHRSRMQHTLVELGDAFGGRPVVWGGDWNQPLTGSLAGFSRAARDAIATSTEALGLQVPTRSLLGRTAGQGSIDHLAVPRSWTVREAGCVPVDVRLSDHDAYWVDVCP